MGVAVGLLVAPLVPTTIEKAESEIEGEREGVPPALAKKLAQRARFAPDLMGALESEGRAAADHDWIEHSTPGLDIPLAALEGARASWRTVKARGGGAGGKWTPLGPTYGKGAENPYRDRSVYNAGTDNFSGRTIAAEIDPTCVPGNCRLWIANANGGVWKTNDALAPAPMTLPNASRARG